MLEVKATYSENRGEQIILIGRCRVDSSLEIRVSVGQCGRARPTGLSKQHE